MNKKGTFVKDFTDSHPLRLEPMSKRIRIMTKLTSLVISLLALAVVAVAVVTQTVTNTNGKALISSVGLADKRLTRNLPLYPAAARRSINRSTAVNNNTGSTTISSPTATITVTNTKDSGSGSLRQAILDAAPGDTINFSITGTITLTSGQLVINKNLTIQGPGANLLTVSGNLTYSNRVFFIAENMTAVLDGMTITGGCVGGGWRRDRVPYRDTLDS